MSSSMENDLSKCPNCGGEADNGHDRCYPPNVYYCTKCETSKQPRMKTLKEEREAIVEEFKSQPYVSVAETDWTDENRHGYLTAIEEIEPWLRTALLSHEEKVMERVREIIEGKVYPDPKSERAKFKNEAFSEIINILTLPITDENV